MAKLIDSGGGGGQGGHDSFRPIFPRWIGLQFFMTQSENPVFGLNLTKLTLI